MIFLGYRLGDAMAATPDGVVDRRVIRPPAF
jgi:hypothetical protein